MRFPSVSYARVSPCLHRGLRLAALAARTRDPAVSFMQIIAMHCRSPRLAQSPLATSTVPSVRGTAAPHPTTRARAGLALALLAPIAALAAAPADDATQVTELDAVEVQADSTRVSGGALGDRKSVV